MERIGKEVKYLFTRHKMFCKLENRYSGVSQGNVIDFQALGNCLAEATMSTTRLSSSVLGL